MLRLGNLKCQRVVESGDRTGLMQRLGCLVGRIVWENRQFSARCVLIPEPLQISRRNLKWQETAAGECGSPHRTARSRRRQIQWIRWAGRDALPDAHCSNGGEEVETRALPLSRGKNVGRRSVRDNSRTTSFLSTTQAAEKIIKL